MITKTTGDSASQRKVPGQWAEARGFEPPMGANPNRISNPGPRGHGSVPRRGTPYVRQTEADVKRQFDVEYNWWLHEWRAWQARRIAITSALLEIPVDQVEPLAIGISAACTASPKAQRPNRSCAMTVGSGPASPGAAASTVARGDDLLRDLHGD